MVDEDEISLTTECPVKVIQVQSPDESPSKSVVLQVSDLYTTTSPFQRGVFVTSVVRWAAETTEGHLCVIAGFVVISHPLVLLDSIRDFLVLDQVDSGPIEKSTNLKRG